MINDSDIQFLENLKKFLIYIGFGDIYGILGHDSGAILSHEVLCNDPSCYSIDKEANKIHTNLKGDDYKNIETVYKDIVSIISEARNNNYVKKLTELTERLKKNEK